MITPDVSEVKNSIHIKNRDFCYKKYPEFTEYIETLYPNVQSHIERLYLYFHPNETYKCKNCGNPTKFINFNKGYYKYCCPGCASKDSFVKESKKSTYLERYGVENPSQSKVIQEKKIATCIKKYGITNTSKLKSNRLKQKQTCLERYGTECYNNPEKSKQTCLERYGVEYFLSDKNVIDRITTTCMKKYGGRGNASTILKEKSKQTCLERYGDPMYNNRSKAKQTMLELYGSETYREHMPHKNTNIENFIINIMNENNIEYELSNRSILNGRELDIYIPSKQIAIECNGCYWHDDKHKPMKYHFQKYNDCLNKNIQLLTFWDDQIYRCPNIAISIIKSKLGIYDKRIYARKCEIKLIDPKTSKEFLVKNHIQGAVNSSIKLGLYYKDELVSIMTFGKSRKCVNGSRDSYELYRFCNKLNTQVVGGASKLFAYFIKHYKPTIISSFSSNDISNGDLYKLLNFEKKSGSISYWYIKNYKRYHRFNFTKSNLVKMGFDASKTEKQIMEENKYHRIYDSGQTKWEYLVE